MFQQMICGFLMALADSVPGVSGGTVAFFLGEYDALLQSFSDIISKDRKRRQQALWFLLRVGFGWLIGLGLSVAVLSRLFRQHIYQVSSLFLGLVISSIPLIIREEKDTIHQCKPWHSLLVFAGGAFVILLSLTHVPVSTAVFSLPTALYLFAGGALAISAMILPGISGSTLLLSFGLYLPVITWVKQFFLLNVSVLPFLLAFGAGVLFGIFVSFKGIHLLLKRRRPATISAILGLMAGSLVAVVIGPTTLAENLPALQPSNFNAFCFVIGLAVSLLFAVGKRIVEKRRNRHDQLD